MSKSSNHPDVKINPTQKRYYWLGHQQESAQDRFFLEALDDNLWEQGSAEQWDTCWFTGMPNDETFQQLDSSKTINHIPGNNALTLKSYLYETLMDAKRHVLGTEQAARYNFFPDTYLMPEDYYRYQADAAAEPDSLWIQKPKNLSRGRGIEVVQHPSTVPFNSDWLIQRYIKEPHLYDGHKYVLRFYVLITSIEPLRFYLYEEGFAKLASEAYDDTELDNLYRHLTNPDINEENENVDVPVTFFSFARYRDWLKSSGHDDEKLFTEFKDLIALSVIAAREKMRHQLEEKTSDTRGCYELIGLDCMVDKDLKPWILECNLSPSLETYASGDAEASDEFTVKRQLVHDLVDMLQLNEPEQDYSYDAKATIESNKRGGFIPLLTQENANEYLNCFPVPRAKDVFALDTNAIDYSLINTQANDDVEVIFDDSLAIVANDLEGDLHFLSPNQLATWIWLKNSEGLTPPQIAAALSEGMPLPEGLSSDNFKQNLLQQVWDTLADWGQAGAFDKEPNYRKQKPISKQWQQTFFSQLNEQSLTVNVACPVAANYLASFLEQGQAENTLLIDTVVNIHPGQYGYTLILGAAIVKENIKLAELVPTLLNIFFSSIARDLHFNGSLIAVKDQSFLVIANDPAQSLEWLSRVGDRAVLLSSFPALADSQRTLKTGTLPLIREAKDSSDIASLVVQAAKVVHRLEKNTRASKTHKLDGILFLEDSNDDDQVNAIAQAKALSLLWPSFFKQDQSTAKIVSQWLGEIPLLQINSSAKLDLDFLEGLK